MENKDLAVESKEAEAAEKAVIDKEDDKVDEIIINLLKSNEDIKVKCVGDTNGTWIYTYNKDFDIQKLNLPEEYSLLTVRAKDATTHHAVAKMIQQNLLTDYHVYFFLFNEEDWL